MSPHRVDVQRHLQSAKERLQIFPTCNSQIVGKPLTFKDVLDEREAVPAPLCRAPDSEPFDWELPHRLRVANDRTFEAPRADGEGRPRLAGTRFLFQVPHFGLTDADVTNDALIIGRVFEFTREQYLGVCVQEGTARVASA